MAEIEAESLGDQLVMIGLLSRSQLREAKEEAEDGSVKSLTRALMRKGWLTSWQSERISRGEFRGFFYGSYKVLFHIAEGTFARVYRGENKDTGDAVAIKVLRRRFSTDTAAVARFAQEAEAGTRLVHPNIVRIFEYGEIDLNYFMIMEYVEGSNLRDLLKIRSRVGATEAMPILLGLAAGLKYSHDSQVTHRDLKGTNILISNRKEAKLVDFGLATVGDDRVTEFAHTRTVDYSALERTCGSPKGDPRSDIYFLGCVYYQMLTGVLPLPEVETADPLAKMLKRSFGAIKPIASLRYAPPPELCRIVEKMMAIKLEQRYQTMTQVLDDLKKYATSIGGSAAAALIPDVAGPITDDDLFAEAFGRRIGESPTSAAKADAAAIAGPERSVLCVEAQSTIQDAFKKAFNKLGYKVLMMGDAERAAERFREVPTDVVVFDVDGQGEDGFDAFLAMHEKAHEDGHPLSALVILGPRQQELAEQMPLDDRLIVLNKPIKMKDVQEALTRLDALAS